jgi:hypothetical protein
MTRGFYILPLLLCGCGGHSSVQLGSGSVPTAGFQGSTTAGALLMIGVLAGVSDGQARVPPPGLDADRAVNAQDCSKPIGNSSANLKCR